MSSFNDGIEFFDPLHSKIPTLFPERTLLFLVALIIQYKNPKEYENPELINPLPNYSAAADKKIQEINNLQILYQNYCNRSEYIKKTIDFIKSTTTENLPSSGLDKYLSRLKEEIKSTSKFPPYILEEYQKLKFKEIYDSTLGAEEIEEAQIVPNTILEDQIKEFFLS